jgi:hypothetical protein
LRSATRIGALALLLALPALPSFGQCAMCATAVANSEEGRAMSAQLNAAILLMLAAPYAVFGTFAAFLFRRRLRGWLLRVVPSRFVPRRLSPPAAPS